MNGAQLYGRSIAFPPKIGADGRMAWSEGEANIRESIQIILKTEEKERPTVPGFGGGLQRFLFEPNTVATRFQMQDRITKALELWEPRVSLTQVIVEQDPADPQSAFATIEYRLVATQLKDRVNLKVRLGN